MSHPVHDYSGITRAPGLVVQAIGTEWVVADPLRDFACAISGPTALVWSATRGPDTQGALTRLADDRGVDEVDAALKVLLENELLRIAPGVTRRSVLAAAGLAGGVLGIGLPDASDAASAIPAQARTFTCTNTAAATPVAASAQTLRVGPSAQLRLINYTLVSGGGGGGNRAQPGEAAGGSGGSGGYQQGTILLLPGDAATLTVYVGCGGRPGDGLDPTNGTSFAGPGQGPGGTGGGTTATGAGGGGGATAVRILSETTASLNVGAGGGGGSGSQNNTTPIGGAGAGLGSGGAGAGEQSTGGGGGVATILSTTGGAAGDSPTRNYVQAADGGGVSTSGGAGGAGGRRTQDLTHAGGGGGGGYTGGGGGGNNDSTIGARRTGGGGGGGSGYGAGLLLNVGVTLLGGAAIITVTAAGTGPFTVNGTSFGAGGTGTTNVGGSATPGSPGVAFFSNTGGFTLT